jgi:hypothetical protein
MIWAPGEGSWRALLSLGFSSPQRGAVPYFQRLHRSPRFLRRMPFINAPTGTISELGDLIDKRGSHVVTQIGIAYGAVRVAVKGILVSIGAQRDPVVQGLRILQTMRPGVNSK